MDRPRIRWRNVGRLAGGLGAGALLLAVLPGLLEPGAPAPLPADVGLEPPPAGGGVYVQAGGRTPRDRDARAPSRPAPRVDRAVARAAHRHHDAASPASPPPASVPGSPRVEEPAPPADPPAVGAPSVPAAVPPPAPPPPAPAPVPPSSPDPAPEAAAEEQPASEPRPNPSAPSQFGFEH